MPDKLLYLQTGKTGARSSTGQSAGLRTRRPKEDNHLQSQHLSNVPENDLARFLAFLSQKDPDLAMVVEHWPNLPEHIKQTIKTLVELQPLLNGANGLTKGQV